jgi:uncharacterized protein (TIGR00369 family)
MSVPWPEDDATTGWEPQYPEFREYIREVFEASAATRMVGAQLGRIEPGYVEVVMPCRPDLTQQYGFVHGGILGLLADAAAALAALTMAPRGAVGLTMEYKINLLGPAFGDRIVAHGRAIRPGRIVSVAAADLYAVSATGREQRVATALASFAGGTRRGRRR